MLTGNVLTEKEAWELGIEEWNNAKECTECVEPCGIWVSKSDCGGLCSFIAWLYARNRIRIETYGLMRSKLTSSSENKAKKDWSLYWWPRTQDGSKKRAEFCRKMAEQCELEATENQSALEVKNP